MATTWMSGAGNLFVMVDGFVEACPADPAAFAREQCALAAPNGQRPDGVILVKRPRAGGGCVMEIYNADGSRPETCGNGLRCVAKLAFDRGHVTTNPFVIETDAGPVTARVALAEETRPAHRSAHGAAHTAEPRTTASSAGKRTPASSGPKVARATVAMGTPRILARGERLQALGGEHAAVLVDVGNPHCVLFVDDEREAPVTTLGPALERHARFPRGTNVEFLALRREGAFLRVWERGVGETQACGTGACAAALAAVDAGRAIPVTLRVPGGVLVVDADGRGGVTLEGPVEELAPTPVRLTGE
ncbi:MAG: diaminopimelate epimerase [Planctomycetes bacterium]|nr:diaminopimelate epimerase [Planctomycetota bacterium]